MPAHYLKVIISTETYDLSDLPMETTVLIPQGREYFRERNQAGGYLKRRDLLSAASPKLVGLQASYFIARMHLMKDGSIVTGHDTIHCTRRVGGILRSRYHSPIRY